MKRKVVILVGVFIIIAAVLQAFHKAPQYRALRKQLGHRPEKGLVIEHVRLFDSEKAVACADQTVVVLGDRIQAVGPDNGVKIPDGSEVIDGTGMTLLPGLTDMHAHLQPSSGMQYIASGVTMVRDLGNSMSRLVELKKAWDSDEEIGPRVLMAGPINGSRGKGEQVTTEEEAKVAIHRYRVAGYVQIKILSDLKPSLVPYVVRTAHAEGMRVSGHVPEGMKAEEFVHAGVDEIQHMAYLLRNLSASGATTTALEAEEGARLDIESASVSRWIKVLKEKGTVIDPTINVYEEKFGTHGGASQMYYQTMLRMLKRLDSEGVSLVVGTDAPRSPGVSLHREMEIWVRAGVPAPRVLQITTIGAARVMKVDRETGSIRVDKKADLVLVDGDPTRNIADVRKCRIVIKGGTVYKSADLYQAASIAPPR
jgi:imidazolonepropionase-like amidohydrolase